jgi:predicted  nucleic acid-binding Zn-ribbon protein
MDRIEKIIAAIVAAIESVQKIKAELDACKEKAAAQDAKVAELETKVADLEAALSVFTPSGM